MWHRVAALLGRTVAELQHCMSSAEFMHWCAFYSLEPWGYDPDNWRTGVVAATVANAAGRKKPLKPSDFMPRPLKRLTPDETLKLLQGMPQDGERRHDV
jgi:hypothetical protein